MKHVASRHRASEFGVIWKREAREERACYYLESKKEIENYYFNVTIKHNKIVMV